MKRDKILIKVIPEQKPDNEGYKVTTYKPVGEIFVNLQPYNSELAKKDYGYDGNGIKYLAISDPVENIEELDYVQYGDEVFIIILLHPWNKHYELVLKEV